MWINNYTYDENWEDFIKSVHEAEEIDTNSEEYLELEKLIRKFKKRFGWFYHNAKFLKCIGYPEFENQNMALAFVINNRIDLERLPDNLTDGFGVCMGRIELRYIADEEPSFDFEDFKTRLRRAAYARHFSIVDESILDENEFGIVFDDMGIDEVFFNYDDDDDIIEIETTTDYDGFDDSWGREPNMTRCTDVSDALNSFCCDVFGILPMDLEEFTNRLQKKEDAL